MWGVLKGLKGFPGTTTDCPFDALDEVADQLCCVLNELFRKDLQLVSILIESVPMNAVMAQRHSLEQARPVLDPIQDPDAESDVVEHIYFRKVVVEDRA